MGMMSVKEYREKAEKVIQEALKNAGFRITTFQNGDIAQENEQEWSTDLTVRLHLGALSLNI